MPFLHTYLVDEHGDWIVDGSGDRIILSSFSYDLTSYDWTRVASSVRRTPFIRSFDIKVFSSGKWSLVVNKKQLIGLYPSQDACIQVLFGLFIRHNASKAGAEAVMTQQLSNGISHIDSSENNIILRAVDINLASTISDIVPSMIDPVPASGLAYFQVIQLEPFTDSGDNMTRDFRQVGILPGLGANIITAAGAYENLAEGASARSLIVQVDTATLAWVDTSVVSRVVTKPVAADPVIDFSVAIDQAVLLATSKALITENSTGGTPTYTYEWYRSTNVVTGITLTNEG